MAHGIGDKAHRLKDRKDDLYQTPPEAVTTLLKTAYIPQTIWEPACGPGSIVRVLRAAGRVVYATDLVDYKTRDQDQAGWDFLLQHQLPIGVQAIVTNPPYKLAAAFVEKAIELGVPVWMLLRLGFLASEGRRQLHRNHLAHVTVFSRRLPMMHREGWEGPRTTSQMDFAWFYFAPKPKVPGVPTVDFVDWRDFSTKLVDSKGITSEQPGGNESLSLI